MPRRLLRHLSALTVAAALIAALSPLTPAHAQRNISLIRDAEIEATLRTYLAPILEAASVSQTDLQLYIVRDNRLNAFVAGGQNLFVNTGFLMQTEHVGQVLGVLAHEVGHIAGGHLSRVGTAQRRAAAESILATVLGVGVSVVAPQVGAAIITGGQGVAVGGLSRFSRSQEQAADQAAIFYLNEIGVSARGMLEVFQILQNQNALAVSAATPYLGTHPLTRDRITFVENQLRHETPDEGPPGDWIDRFERMQAKLDGFIEDPRRVVQATQGDTSVPGRYAHAIALYRIPDLEPALAEIDGLLAEQPADPYFHELKGQMLFEHGRVDESIGPYQEAVRLRPRSALLRIGLAQSLVETGDVAASREAVGHLEEAIKWEPRNATAWRLLGISRGRSGQEGMAQLALAEYAVLTGNDEDARLFIQRAETRLDPGNPAWLRLQDIRRVLDES